MVDVDKLSGVVLVIVLGGGLVEDMGLVALECAGISMEVWFVVEKAGTTPWKNDCAL